MPRAAPFVAGLAGLALSAAPSVACDDKVIAKFQESAPKDRLVIENKAPNGWRIDALEWRLQPSAGRLVFDTEPGGLGVDVYQPFEAEQSQVRLLTAPSVADGDQSLSLGFEGFSAGQSFSFTIDLDDQLGRSEIRVAGNEIVGAELALTMTAPDGLQQNVTARFDTTSIAVAHFNCGA